LLLERAWSSVYLTFVRSFTHPTLNLTVCDKLYTTTNTFLLSFAINIGLEP
jgi:hypothetical protein